ncbi:TPA: nucleoside deaminase [Providencia rettgeri]|nr:nucleoside deaminase [Providencia rettgeri]
MVINSKKEVQQHELDIQFMTRTLAVATDAAKKGNEPFGAILVKSNQIVMIGENHIHTESDPTYHAEIGLIRKFCSEHKITDLSEYTLYTSCEPCCMCSGAMVWSQLGRMVYSLSHDELAEIAGFNIMLGSDEIFAKSPFKPTVVKGILKEHATTIYKQYFKRS